MTRLNIPAKEEATGVVKQGYDMFLKNVGIIPKPMEMLSVSPALFESQLKRIEYFSKHPTLTFALLAHIRFCVSHHLDYQFCTDLNQMILSKLGLDESQIASTAKDPSTALLEDNEKAMLIFVMKAIQSPGSVTDDDIENLRENGWTDSDMVDAMAQGVSMMDHAIMMQAFNMDQHCML